ncbi:hypothetical protein CANCADRAFT_1588 [Tortispora caseinolytica NRRL Y-17796]|uniref:Uncharacterized protein n=1 Tax=Tortispora caseinolytica NRRL Y-17796 TaxID=767744 RepID=A0A1E4TDS2_9ASCO|nr:hypothetical protein CANCADRAFT_1588 [Tortispora caseinolytica NRRL Y-17796]
MMKMFKKKDDEIGVAGISSKSSFSRLFHSKPRRKQSMPNLSPTTPEDLRCAGAIIGTRTHEWGTVSERNKATVSIQPVEDKITPVGLGILGIDDKMTVRTPSRSSNLSTPAAASGRSSRFSFIQNAQSEYCTVSSVSELVTPDLTQDLSSEIEDHTSPADSNAFLPPGEFQQGLVFDYDDIYVNDPGIFNDYEDEALEADLLLEEINAVPEYFDFDLDSSELDTPQPFHIMTPISERSYEIEYGSPQTSELHGHKRNESNQSSLSQDIVHYKKADQGWIVEHSRFMNGKFEQVACEKVKGGVI